MTNLPLRDSNKASADVRGRISPSAFMEVTELAAIKVFCVKVLCPDPAQIGAVSQEAFPNLESRLPKKDGEVDLKGRRMYGTYHEGEYRACATIKEGEDPNSLGLGTWEIPGGNYARVKIDDWKNNTSKIGPAFDEMARKYKRDAARPLIEFYHRQSELILLMPIA